MSYIPSAEASSRVLLEQCLFIRSGATWVGVFFGEVGWIGVPSRWPPTIRRPPQVNSGPEATNSSRPFALKEKLADLAATVASSKVLNFMWRMKMDGSKVMPSGVVLVNHKQLILKAGESVNL